MSTHAPPGHQTLAYHAPLPTPLGEAHLLGTVQGLVAIALPDESYAAARALLARRLGPFVIEEARAPLAAALDQLAAYFAGTRRAFDLPLDLRGTPFQQAVWRAVLAIPYGETRRYGAIAATIGRPAAARAVGAANAANPLAPLIPCHRLVGTDGTLRGHRSGLAAKRWLLAHERRCSTPGMQ